VYKYDAIGYNAIMRIISELINSNYREASRKFKVLAVVIAIALLGLACQAQNITEAVSPEVYLPTVIPITPESGVVNGPCADLVGKDEAMLSIIYKQASTRISGCVPPEIGLDSVSLTIVSDTTNPESANVETVSGLVDTNGGFYIELMPSLDPNTTAVDAELIVRRLDKSVLPYAMLEMACQMQHVEYMPESSTATIRYGCEPLHINSGTISN
jgi:hypothetical protein